jgi:hypothetical protein
VASIDTLSATEITGLETIIALGDSEKALAFLVAATDREADRQEERLHDYHWHAEAISMADRQMRRAEDTLASLMHRRIAPATIQNLDLPALGKQIAAYAQEKGMVPVAKFYSDWLQVEASFIASDNGFDVIIHLPLMEPGSEMDIYRHVHLPIPLSAQYHLSVDSGMEYLAVSSDANLFRAMPAAELLLQCHRVGYLYLCPLGNVVRSAPSNNEITAGANDQTCLWALFTQRYEAARTLCDQTITTRAPMVVQLSPSRFAVYSIDDHQGHIRCRHTKGQQAIPFPAHHITMVTLQPGCWARTATHRFSSSASSYTRPEGDWEISFKWPYSSEEMANGLNMTQFHAIATMAAKLGNTWKKLPLENAIQQVREAKEQADSSVPPSWLPHISASFAFLTALFAIALTMFNSIRHNRTSPIAMPFAAASALHNSGYGPPRC